MYSCIEQKKGQDAPFVVSNTRRGSVSLLLLRAITLLPHLDTCNVAATHTALAVDSKLSFHLQTTLKPFVRPLVAQLDIPNLRCVRKDGVRLDELLGKVVVEPFQQVRPHSGPCTSGDGVRQHEPLQMQEVVL